MDDAEYTRGHLKLLDSLHCLKMYFFVVVVVVFSSENTKY